jgi:hypothetical protein
MSNYADSCSSLERLELPVVGWFASNNVDWDVPSGRLNTLKGYVQNSTDLSDWQGEVSIGETLYTNYIRSTSDVINGAEFIIAETLSLSETSTNLRGLVSTTTESLSLSETITALKGISFTIAESLGLVESYAFLRTRLFVIAYSLGLIEVKAYVQKKWSNVAKSTVATVTNGVKTAVSVITNRPKS